jgi:hypothetical protein
LSGFNDEKIHPICHRPSDEFQFPGQRSFRLDLPTCTPSKSSHLSLAKAGTHLGLGPSTKPLARLTSLSFIESLLSAKIIEKNLFSVTLLSAEIGVLSLGGTIAREVEEAKTRADIELQNFGNPIATKDWVDQQVKKRMHVVMPDDSHWDEHFKWTDVMGSEGWWTVLLRGIWIGSAKVCLSLPHVLIPPPLSSAPLSHHR